MIKMSESLHPINDRSTSVRSDLNKHFYTKQYRHINPVVVDAADVEHTDPRCPDVVREWRLVEEEAALSVSEELCETCHGWATGNDWQGDDGE